MIEFFKEIAKVPRPSYHEEKIAAYLLDFAKKHGLEAKSDEKHNVVIYCPATAGRETDPVMILQAHSDMVCEKEQNVSVDFENDGIDIIADGDFLRANGTTLGADDGIGIAMMLKIMDDKSISHPALECLFTSCEEVGMEGAYGLDESWLSGHTLINLDSEEEGEFIVGCAGGGNFYALFDELQSLAAAKPYKLSVSGLLGGHSGTDINVGRANANYLLGQLLHALTKEVPIRIGKISGGLRDNAIPRNATATIYITGSDEENAKSIVSDFLSKINTEYENTDPGIEIKLKNLSDASFLAYSEEDSKKLAGLIANLPNGVISMDPNLPDLVQTSLSLGIIAQDDSLVKLTYHIRSSSREEFASLAQELVDKTFDSYCGYQLGSSYPAWEPKSESYIVKKAVEAYKKTYKSEPKVSIIHAGLEGGVLSEKIANLDAISLGPTITGAHSPSETLSISSAERTFKLLVEILTGA